ncbi:hypothetical protein HDV05_004436 [Chytridiales sp. JEL 0842]|nr:hypothetical protein HDV05_004436 [Chytridiales sp. JEL 0842]
MPTQLPTPAPNTLSDRIVHQVLQKPSHDALDHNSASHDPHYLNANNHFLNDQMTSDEYDALVIEQRYQDEADMEECEEMVEEIPEMELLAMLDAEEDSLHICRRLFHARIPWEGVCLNGADLEERAMRLEECLGEELEVLGGNGAVEMWEKGWTVVDTVFDTDPSIVSNAQAYALHLFQTQQLHPASTHRLEDDPFRDRKARDDHILFLHPPSSSSNISQDPHAPFHPLFETFTRLQRDLSKLMHLHFESEFQLAVYQAGHYERHRDAFPTDNPSDTDQRRVTAIIYLADEEEDGVLGGGLRIYRPLGTEGEVVNLRRGRLVVFLSGVVDHEVLEVHGGGARVAVTSWMK